MKAASFPKMIEEYKVRPIEQEDLEERQRLLSGNPFSVIFEGDFREYDNALDWIKVQLGMETVNHIFYGKMGYDYGFFEFFFSNKADAIKFTDILPGLYTKFADGSVSRTDGMSNYIDPPT